MDSKNYDLLTKNKGWFDFILYNDHKKKLILLKKVKIIMVILKVLQVKECEKNLIKLKLFGL